MDLAHSAPDRECIPKRGQFTLDGFSDDVSATEGVSLSDLEPLTTLLVRTRNSLYRIIVLRGTTVLVRGGRSFGDVTLGVLNGSSSGGNLLKLAWIGVGLCMEIHSDGRRIVTSPVRAITAERNPSPDSPSAPAQRDLGRACDWMGGIPRRSLSLAKAV